jgi:hypothetical protein
MLKRSTSKYLKLIFENEKIHMFNLKWCFNNIKWIENFTFILGLCCIFPT